MLQKKIQADADREQLKIQRQSALERKKLAREEAVVQGALAVIKALPNLFAAAAAAAEVAVELAVIDRQKFSQGGFTGSKGYYRDDTGHEVAGAVHTDEWVAAPWMLKDPRTAPSISYLENVRKNRGGFADGGFTSVNTTPSTYVQTVTTTGSSAAEQEIINLLREMNAKISAWPTNLKARVVLTELQTSIKDLADINSQANA